jgi:predicted nucleic acid-binding protein
MKFVLDANVALKWVIPEKHSDKALRLRSDTLAGIHESHAPEIFAVEVGHALTRAERKGDIPVGDADVHLLYILLTSPHFHSSLAMLRRAVAISSAARIGLYDCLYVALAEQERCDLVTADDKLIKNLQPRFPFIVPLSSLP